jgi:hypothetical protein
MDPGQGEASFRVAKELVIAEMATNTPQPWTSLADCEADMMQLPIPTATPPSHAAGSDVSSMTAEHVRIGDTSLGKQGYNSYSLAYKLKVVTASYQMPSLSAASRKFAVPRKTLREWRQNEAALRDAVLSKCEMKFRMSGGGIRPRFPELEAKLAEWYRGQREEGVRMSLNIIGDQAKLLYAQLDPALTENKTFYGSHTWVHKFLKRNHFPSLMEDHVARYGTRDTK